MVSLHLFLHCGESNVDGVKVDHRRRAVNVLTAANIISGSVSHISNKRSRAQRRFETGRNEIYGNCFGCQKLLALKPTISSLRYQGRH